MARGNPTESVPDAAVRDGLSEVLSRHPVAFALMFGSTVHGTAKEDSDLDVAVEFEDARPDNAGYSRIYLRLSTDLADSLPTSVDLVDVHSMSPRFARAVFDAGELLIGTEEERRALEAELSGEPISMEEARERVSAAVDRMKR